MTTFGIMIDKDACFNCKACMVACMQENDLSGRSWISVITVGPRKVGGNILVDYVPVTCSHCKKPPCANVCPAQAITRRGDGLVVIDSSLCNGCMACVSACPFAVIRFNEEKGVAEKCDLCLRRVERGLKPACVQHCQAGAILFGDMNEISELMMKQRLRRKMEHSNGYGAPAI